MGLVFPKIKDLLEEHEIGGETHLSDSLANLNTKILDAALDDENDERTPKEHGNEAHESDYQTESDVSTSITSHKETEVHDLDQPPEEHGNEAHDPNFTTQPDVNGSISTHASDEDAHHDKVHDIINEHETTEMDVNKYLKPDGAGSFEWSDKSVGVIQSIPNLLASSGAGSFGLQLFEASSRITRYHTGTGTNQTGYLWCLFWTPPDFLSPLALVIETRRNGATLALTLRLSLDGVNEPEINGESVRPASDLTFTTFTFDDFGLTYSAAQPIMLRFLSTLSTGQFHDISRIMFIYRRK